MNIIICIYGKHLLIIILALFYPDVVNKDNSGLPNVSYFLDNLSEKVILVLKITVVVIVTVFFVPVTYLLCLKLFTIGCWLQVIYGDTLRINLK